MNGILVSEEDIQKASEIIRSKPGKCRRTPLIRWIEAIGQPHQQQQQCQLFLKLENMQVTGSYKVRGIINQLHAVQEKIKNWQDVKLVTMSAGNYGKAFAFLSDGFSQRLVVLQNTAPANRDAIIRGYGAEVERVEGSEMSAVVERHETNDSMIFMNPLNDCSLLAGHGSLGLEIVEDLPEVDVVLVPCGGGILLAGVATAIHYRRGDRCRVYGIEPENACTMSESLRLGSAQKMPAKSIAVGLAPPYCGEHAVNHCQKFVQDILIVPDSSIVQATLELYSRGLVVEPSGAAAYAALSLGIVPDVIDKKVVVVITGGNISPQELVQLSENATRCSL